MSKKKLVAIKPMKAIPNVMEYDSLKVVEIKNTTTTINTIADVLDNNIHIAITHSIIKKIASNPMNISMKACLDIVNSGYTQTIVNDIEQEIATTLINWYANASIFGVVKISNNKLVFDSYTNKNGVEKSYYNKLYGVVESVLYSYSNHSHRNDGKIVNYDVLVMGQNSDIAMTSTNSNYVKSVAYDGGLNDVIKRHDFDSFIEYLSTSKLVSLKRQKAVISVFYGLLDGLNSEEIANRYKLTIDVVKKCRSDIKKVYSYWVVNGGGIDIKQSNNDMFNGVASGISYAIGESGVYSDRIDSYDSKYDYTPTIGAFTFTSKDDKQDIQYSADSFIEYRKNATSIDVYYTNYIDIDGETRKNAIYQHSIDRK